MSPLPLNITLKDGKIIQKDASLTVAELAESISRSLAKNAVAGKVNGNLVDLSFLIESDAKAEIITAESNEGLDIIRHSTAHLSAHAVKELFPSVQLTIGPVIEDGFYYDFYYPDKFLESDLEKIEKRMHEIAKRDYAVERLVWSRSEAIDFFKKQGETYKVKLIADIPENELITLYKEGDFIDLCRGPHISRTSQLKAFKLTKLAGAYWRGDAKNEVLQRIYGTAFESQRKLDDYLKLIEEAKARDHRLFGQKMDLFHLQPEAPGMIFWHANGWNIYKELKNYISQRLITFGYQEICTPLLLDRSLWEKSGHWDKYSTNMFITESEKRLYALKPMNCPAHIQIFKQGLKSYRDLPIRYAEFGCCHRNEYSGTLHGLFRVRGFVQDDGHILCTEDQVAYESERYLEQLCTVYADLGFHDIIVKLATRPEKRIGEDALWDKAEKALQNALDARSLKWELNPGEGAFYGPKVEVSLKDCLNRVWQCGTLQIDFSMPERLGAYYIAEDGSKKPPVMLHRAMLGSLERFIGVLLEHTAGNLPLWLAPMQAIVMNITDEQGEYVKKITQELQNFGVRVNFDLRNEKIGFKIREHSIQRVPYQLIVGNKEMTSGTVAVRTRDGKDLGIFTLDKLKELLKREIESKR